MLRFLLKQNIFLFNIFKKNVNYFKDLLIYVDKKLMKNKKLKDAKL